MIPNTIKTIKGNKRHTVGIKGKKLSPFAADVIVHIEKTKESTKKTNLLELKSKLSKVQATRLTHKNELYCCILVRVWVY